MRNCLPKPSTLIIGLMLIESPQRHSGTAPQRRRDREKKDGETGRRRGGGTRKQQRRFFSLSLRLPLSPSFYPSVSLFLCGQISYDVRECALHTAEVGGRVKE